MAKPTTVYWGACEDMIAEVAAWDPRQIGIPAKECRYLVMCYGEGQYDTEWFSSKSEARRHARYIAKDLGVPVGAV